MKKNLFNKIVCSLLFISIIFASVVALTFFVRPKADTKAAGYKHASAMQILGEKENSVDVLVLGDSLAYRSFMPLRVWQKSGITSYVCGTPSQRLYYSEEFLRIAFESQSPKIVLVETNAIFRNTDVSQILTNELERSLGFFRFHNRWKTLSRSDITSVLSVDYSQKNTLKGYNFTRKTKKADTTGYMAYTTEVEPIDTVNNWLIKQISRLCRKNNARLILYSAPSVENYSYARHNALVDLSEKLDCEYIDLNLLRSEVPIKWSYSSTDGGDHLNYVGATKVSDYFAKYLSELKIFEDKRSDEDYSEEWDAALQKFIEDNQIKSDKKEANHAKKKSIKKEIKRFEKEQEKLREATGNPNAVLPPNLLKKLERLTEAAEEFSSVSSSAKGDSSAEETTAEKSKKKSSLAKKQSSTKKNNKTKNKTK